MNMTNTGYNRPHTVKITDYTVNTQKANTAIGLFFYSTIHNFGKIFYAFVKQLRIKNFSPPSLS